jgi:hypothetical protein
MAHVEELLAHGEPVGKWLGHDTIDRYVTTGLCIGLVREGWIGICGVTTCAIDQIVQAAVEQGHSVVLAEETGDQPALSDGVVADPYDYEA